MAEAPENKEKVKPINPEAFLDELESDQSQDPDTLLAEALPNLEKEMKQLQSDFMGLNADIETLEFGEREVDPHPSQSFKEKWQIFKRKWKKRFENIGLKIFYRFKYLLIWLAFEAPKKILRLAKKIFQVLANIYASYSRWSLRRKVFFFFSFLAIAITTGVYYQVIKSRVLYQDSFHFYGSMAELAEYSFSYDVKGSTEPFYNSPRVKVYSFQMKPVVVNLKREEEESQNPMAFFEFIFEGNSGDVVVELKERESEFVDLVGRVVETKTFESLDTTNGKAELKENIRRELNKKLTDGVIRRVEIRNFFIKP